MFNLITPRRRPSTKQCALLISAILVALMLLTAVACAVADVPPADAISESEAEQIALDHAGLAKADVTMQRTEYDYDDGVPEYEIEFRRGNVEYDYTIHAISGKILHHEQDQGD